MAASNYMTEADTESIWDTTLDTTRFGKIGVRIAELLNFWINNDATSQVTDTGVTPILEQLSEEILMSLINAAKSNKFTDVWQFIQMNVTRITSQAIQDNWVVLNAIKLKLTKHYIYTESANLPFPQDITSLSKRTTS